MKALFVELTAFSRHRGHYLDDEAFHKLQSMLLANPERGARIPGGGGLRKLRFADAGRRKGKRGGLRVIYFWWAEGRQFWLFTLFNKGEMADLTPQQLAALSALLESELEARRNKWQIH